MPKLLDRDGYRFFFYSREGNEPPHVHVTKGDCEAKFWLTPVRLEGTDGCKPREVKRMEKLVAQHAEAFKTRWHEYFDD